jgi:SRSO17 transposase
MKQTAQEHTATVAAARQWAGELESLAALMGKRFPRTEPRQRARAYVQGLLSPIARKNGWQLAEYAGDAAPYGVQHLLGRATWSADAVRDDLRTYVVEHLGEPGAVLVIDETGFLKKGTKSVGVARQYSGTAGRVENCQIGVFLAYVTGRGRTFLDRELYLPREWATDLDRRAGAGVPAEVPFATKPQLARQMIARALAAGVPCRWVTGDSVYGSDWRMRSWLEEQQLSYVLGVTAQYRIFTGHTREWAAAVVGRLAPDAWRRVSCGAGSKGERRYDWAWLPLGAPRGEHQRWLLARRNISDPTQVAYDVGSGPPDTSLEQLVRVVGTRWAIEESVETAQGEVGLAHDEVRSWHGWYRHVTLALWAHAYLTVLRAHAAVTPQATQKKRGASRRPRRGRDVDSSYRSRSAAPTLVAGVGLPADACASLPVVAGAAPPSSGGQTLPLPTALSPSRTSTTVVLGGLKD